MNRYVVQLKQRKSLDGKSAVFDELVPKAVCSPHIPIADGDGETLWWKSEFPVCVEWQCVRMCVQVIHVFYLFLFT